jgi:hypothetical protein
LSLPEISKIGRWMPIVDKSEKFSDRPNSPLSS